MKIIKTAYPLFFCGILLFASTMRLPAEDATAILRGQQGNLLNGTFKPKAASPKSKISENTEAGATFIRLEGGPTAVEMEIPVTPEMKDLTFGGNIRVTNFKQGSGQWDVPNVMILFLDGSREKLEGKFSSQKGSTDWRTIQKTVSVPAGAVTARLILQNRGSAGFADFKDVFLISAAGGNADAGDAAK